jgi:CheY-like chemotaxis protein
MSAQPQAQVLVVDDEPDLQELIAFEFGMCGFRALSAGNGQEAFAIAQREKIDAVVTDIRMPGGDGVELLGKLKELNCETPVVLFITAFADLSAEEAYHRGAEGIFTKPFDRKALVQTVKRSLLPPQRRWVPEPGAPRAPIPLHLSLPPFDVAASAGRIALGRGGFFVALSEDVPHPGELLDLRLGFQDGRSIEGTGAVRWARNSPAGCGIEILSLDDGCREWVIEKIRATAGRPYIPRGLALA